ncbi:serine/threonine-protein kinase [Streptomyces tibetensis]|uniref:serine/threonine-protein kinase n=1 Tax=Streptomyces tibetensis TaxID=2382123 RepID=UPI0033D7E790
MERGELIAGRYELLKRLGRGGMGEVWAARDRALHRDVALKLLDLDGAVHPELPQRFEREAVAAAQINHPNVAALYDRGIHEDMLFLVMEKVEGLTLTEHIHAESPISLARALEIATGICTALVAAHQAHVIHYDIKPHNVMLTPDGQVKVVDLGIAGFVQTTFTVARSSQLTPAGTPEYGAPEQFLTERGDERSDLYALGGVLFALLTGQPPFTGHNGLAVMRRKLDEEAPRLDALRPDLPPAVTALVAELLQRDPDRRPQSARLVHERLQQLQVALDPANESTSDLYTTKVQPPRTLPMDSTQQPPEKGGPFTLSWTGKEPLSAYTDTRQGRGVVVGFTIALAVALVGVFISLALGQDKPFAVEPGHPSGWTVMLVVFSSIGIFCLAMLLLAAMVRLFPRDKSAWTLQIGPPGVRTSHGLDRREYRWSQVQTFAIEEVVGNGGERATAGLHVKFVKGDKRRDLHLYRPAGWPFPARAIRRNGMLPVCVLGPMTDQQRAALRSALAQYGHGKSDAEAWGE